MLHKANPTKTKSWLHLSEHFEKIKDVRMKDLFANDPQRFNRFSIRFKDILLDYSKNRITEESSNYGCVCCCPLLTLALF